MNNRWGDCYIWRVIQGLEKRVTGDWFVVREAAKELDTLEAALKIPPEQLRIQIEKLQAAVEQGVVEYKRAAMAPLFSLAEAAKFRAPGLDEVRRQFEYTSALLYAMLVQRLIAEGTIRVAREKQPDETIDADALDLTAILRDVNDRIRRAPELTNNPLVKNIQLQAGQMRRERESMQKLLPTIKPEVRDTFQQNYRKSFGELVDKIKRSYAALLKEEAPVVEEARPILAAVKLADVVAVLTQQCQCVAQARSTLAFAGEEKYGIGELFASLVAVKASFDQLLRREIQACAKLEAAAQNERVFGERSITRAFCGEIVRILQRGLA